MHSHLRDTHQLSACDRHRTMFNFFFQSSRFTAHRMFVYPAAQCYKFFFRHFSISCSFFLGSKFRNCEVGFYCAPVLYIKIFGVCMQSVAATPMNVDESYTAYNTHRHIVI